MNANIYDALAPHYRQYADAKASYLQAVDGVLLSRAPTGARSLLDVGAGDGVRGMALAKALRIDRTVLCDSSAEMAARCRALSPSEVWQCAAEDMPQAGERFDIVLCLWNVLGHIAPAELRVRALQSMARVLAPQGRLFLDVNNRHNASAYGWLRIAGRVILDGIAPDDGRGDTSFEWEVGGQRLPARGHLFTPAEMADLARRAGLRIERRLAVDYRTGAVSACVFRGQLVYELSSDAS